MSLANNKIITQVSHLWGLHVAWKVCPCLFGCHQVAFIWITRVNVLSKCSAHYHTEMYSNSWFIQCGKLCYLEVYRGLLYFTIPSTGSNLYWSLEFRQQKLIKGDFQRVNLHKWTVKIMAAKCVSWRLVGFLEYTHTHTHTYSSAPVSTGNMFQDLLWLYETGDNT
jgi:hypothetical protein